MSAVGIEKSPAKLPAGSSISFHNMSFPFESENWLADGRPFSSRMGNGDRHTFCSSLRELDKCGIDF